MHDDPPFETTPSPRVTATELAGLVGDPVERVEELTARGVLAPDADGRYAEGDAHRIRVIDGFEAAGVPLDVLVEAQEAGLISVAYYDDLHAPPGTPSPRTYQELHDALGARRALLPSMYGAFGIAQPAPTTHLSLEDEAFIEDLVELVEAAGQTDLVLRIIRHVGEATRRASAASLEVYAEAIDRMGPELAGVPSQDVYDQVFLPWARMARTLPSLAGWLTRQHISRAIDDYSIGTTEQVLAASGYVPRRPDVQPAVVFLDLTGFTSLTQTHGDTIAADVALRLGALASEVAAARHGRVVKLLGDGVLMHFPDVVEGVEASVELMDRLVAADLPAGHVGVSQGPVVARDGDIFGRTVNLAARISDVAPSGELYFPSSIGAGLAARFRIEPVGPVALPGIGVLELARIVRPTSAGTP
jgi:class 3 adenylate cyclase